MHCQLLTVTQALPETAMLGQSAAYAMMGASCEVLCYETQHFALPMGNQPGSDGHQKLPGSDVNVVYVIKDFSVPHLCGICDWLSHEWPTWDAQMRLAVAHSCIFRLHSDVVPSLEPARYLAQ